MGPSNAARLTSMVIAALAFAGVPQCPLQAQRVRATDRPLPLADTFTQRAWTLEDGLPQGSTHDLAQTADGYLWVATYGGLVRFDGRRLSVVDATTLPSLATGRVHALARAPQGGVWVAAAGAQLFRTDGRRELEVLPARRDAGRVVRLAVAPDGSIWVASTGSVERYTRGRWTTFDAAECQAQTVRTFAIDHAGVVWVGPARGGLVAIDGDHCARVDVAGLDHDAGVLAVFEDRDRRLWVGDSRGLAEIRSDGAARRAVRVSGLTERVTAITQSGDGTLWIGAADGLYVVAPLERGWGAFPRKLASSEVFGGSLVTHLLATPSGAVVAGTNDRGFRVFTPRAFERLESAQGLPGTRVHHVADDGVGGLWIGTGCDGLTRLHGSSGGEVEVHVPPALGLRSPCVRGLMRDRRAALWVGQGDGVLTRVDPGGSSRTWDDKDGLPRADVGPLFEDTTGRVWVGSAAGVVCRVDGADRMACPAVALPDPPQTVWSLAEDGDGNIWIGQVGRVTRVSAHDARTWTSADGIPRVPIRALAPEDGRTMWLGTYGAGLARMRGDRVVSITARQGLFDNSISAFVEDDAGAVWLLGNRGVFLTRREDLDSVADGSMSTLGGVAFGPADGVPEGNAGHPAATRLRDGRVAFATVQGLVLFDPRRLSATPAPSVLIEDVIGGQQDAGDRGTFTVPPGGGPVEIRFAAPSIGDAGSVRVRYQLSGRDRTWLQSGTDRPAVYSGLPPGLFEFRTSVRRANGPWSDPVTALTLRVRPLWWQTWTARALALAATLLAVLGLVRLRLRSVEASNRALAREIQNRQRAEEDAHRHLLALARVGRLAAAGELAAALAHELGQPLTAVVASTGAARMMLGAGSPDLRGIDEVLATVEEQGRRASDVLRGLKTFLRRGQPEFAEVDVGALVREVMSLMDSTLAAAGVRLALQLADDLPSVRGDRVPLQQVVVNLTLNAIEAMREQPVERRNLLVRARHTPRHVRVSVLDRGSGLGRSGTQGLFEPFHTTKPDGMGIGLAICRSIVEAHDGCIRARNRPGGGAAFSFTLPVGDQPDA